MMRRAAGRAVLAIRLGALALLLAAVVGMLGLPGAGEVAAQGTRDYDRDGDRLIEVRNLAELDAIRYDMDGDGRQDSVSDEDWAKYQAAFRNAMPGMGCDPGCVGYELMNDLDFDENRDGAMSARGDPTYWNDGKGWHPIGAPPDFNADMGFCYIPAYCYTAIFDGNGHTISNLYINRLITNNVEYSHVGLFGATLGHFRNVGLVNPYISITRSGTAGSSSSDTSYTTVGALLGYAFGSGHTHSGNWVSGGGITFVQGEGTFSTVGVGCLVGRDDGPTIRANDATCAVHVTSPLNHDYTQSDPTANRDSNVIYAGGLVGYVANSDIIASYARGNVTCRGLGQKSCGGLVGRSSRIHSSYATGDVVNEAYFKPYLRGTTCELVYTENYTGGLTGFHWISDNYLIRDSYATGRVTSPLEDTTCTGQGPVGTPAGQVVGGLIGRITHQGYAVASYWDTESSGLARRGECTPRSCGIAKTTAELQTPTDYTGIYADWDRDPPDRDENARDNGDPWDFGTARQYPILKYQRDKRSIARQRARQPRVTQYRPKPEPVPYVAPPIVYNLNIRFNVKGLTLDEGESATYRVRMSRPPAGHPARVAITSNNPDVVVAPTEVTFSSADYNQWQTVKVTTLRDANDTDENATLAHRGPNLSYGSILVSVNDTWPGAAVETVNGHTVTMRHTLDAPYGVRVTAPDTLDADTDITIAGPPAGTPQGAPGYGLGQSEAARMLADIRVQGTPADGLTICLPAPEPLVTEAGERPLTLLRYADGGWAPVAGAELRDGTGVSAMLCADGITEYGVFAAAYMLPALGAVSDLVATAGDAPGTVTLTWTPGANAAMHWVAGVKRSDMSDFAVWAAADAMGSHTVSGLDGGATYIFTVTAGRGEGDGREWSAWAAWVTAVAD